MRASAHGATVKLERLTTRPCVRVGACFLTRRVTRAPRYIRALLGFLNPARRLSLGFMGSEPVRVGRNPPHFTLTVRPAPVIMPVWGPMFGAPQRAPLSGARREDDGSY